jgi:hypothetical protein
MTAFSWTAVVAVLGLMAGTATAQSAAPPLPPGALSPENLAKPRPKAPFDVTGTWQHELKGPQSWKFVPQTFELTAAAQVEYDAGRKAAAENKVYRDDIGQCWPAGMPLIMTRVHPFLLMQYPTAIFMVQNFMNSLRIIYMDGRPHSDPDVVVPSWNGESIGHWEATRSSSTRSTSPGTIIGSTRVARASRRAQSCTSSSACRMIENGETLEIEYTMTDPKTFKGDWKTTKRFNRQHDVDIYEVECTPDLNENLPATSSQSLIR